MSTRSRKKKAAAEMASVAEETVEAQTQQLHGTSRDELHALAQAVTEDVAAEQRRQREEVTLLVQKAAAAEERAFHMSTTMKELHQEVQHLLDKVSDTRARLTEVERSHRKMDDAMRTKARDSIEEIRRHVLQLTPCTPANVAGRVAAMRAESMISEIEDSRSEVSSATTASAITAATGYAHSSIEALRAAQRHRP